MDLQSTNRQKNFFTRAEVAQLFEVAPNTVNRWVLAGRLPSVVTPGGRRRYPAGAILQMLDEQMRGASAYAVVQRIGHGLQESHAAQSGRPATLRQTRAGRANRSRRRSG